MCLFWYVCLFWCDELFAPYWCFSFGFPYLGGSPLGNIFRCEFLPNDNSPKSSNGFNSTFSILFLSGINCPCLKAIIVELLDILRLLEIYICSPSLAAIWYIWLCIPTLIPFLIWVRYFAIFHFQVILAQVVIYLARAPKSVEVYKAYNAAKNLVKNWKRPLPGVPLHLRNAPTKLMKELNYGKGYKYNPDFEGPVEQDYLPSELKGTDFFATKW